MGDRLQQFVKAYLAGRIAHWPKTPEQLAVVREWIISGTRRLPS